MLPAIPPNDYEGTINDWVIALIERGYDGEKYWDVKIPEDVYDDVLEECER